MSKKLTISQIIKRDLQRVGPISVASLLWKETKKFSNYDDHYEPAKNTMIEYMLSLHVREDAERLFGICESFYKVMKGKKPSESIYAGDMDVYLNIIHDTKKKVVFYIRNVCSCADITNWMIVWDRSSFANQIHVRQIHTTSDYPKEKYPEKLGLKFYRDRKFVIDYIEKYHMTNLGGVYGDVRDRGYVISLKKYNGEGLETLNEFEMSKDIHHLHAFYNDYRHAMWSIDMLEKKIKSGEDL